MQFAVLRFSGSETAARIALPATIAAVPFALWPYRRRMGVWVIYVGLAANLAAIAANGGLMPIERPTVAEAVGAERAAEYAPGRWIDGSKDVLVRPGQGYALALGDSIVVPVGGAGFVASPGDVVIWSGLLLLATEMVYGLSKGRRDDARTESEDRLARLAPKAEGSATN